MIKQIISGLIMIVFVIGGAFAADALKPDPNRAVSGGGHEPKTKGHGAEADAGHGTEKKKETKKSGGHGGGHGSGKDAGETEYYKFSRQFIVPVVEGSNVQSLVMLDLNLDVDSEMMEEAYSLEPRLRDSIMTELLTMSNEGYFSARMTDPQNYAEIRERLLEASRRVVPEGVNEVLILDLARQDQ